MRENGFFEEALTFNMIQDDCHRSEESGELCIVIVSQSGHRWVVDACENRELMQLINSYQWFELSMKSR